jgi:hypothetical protein
LPSTISLPSSSREPSNDDDDLDLNEQSRLQPRALSPDLKSRVIVRIMRSLLRMGTVGLAYLLMLIVMSFNVGLVLAVLFGLGLGSLMWGDVIALNGSHPEKEHCC